MQNLTNFYHIHHDQSSSSYFLSSLNFYNSLQTGLFSLYPFRAPCDLAPAIFPQPSQSFFFLFTLLQSYWPSYSEEAYFYLRAFELDHLAWSSLTYLLYLLPHLFQMWPYQRGLPCLLFVKCYLPSSCVLPSIFLFCFFSVALNTIYSYLFLSLFFFPIPFPSTKYNFQELRDIAITAVSSAPGTVLALSRHSINVKWVNLNSMIYICYFKKNIMVNINSGVRQTGFKFHFFSLLGVWPWKLMFSFVKWH